MPTLVGVGMCGAGLDLLADGTGYVIGYMAVAGLALRTPPRVALLAGSPVVAAIAGVEATDAANPAATTLAVLAGSRRPRRRWAFPSRSRSRVPRARWIRRPG